MSDTAYAYSRCTARAVVHRLSRFVVRMLAFVGLLFIVYHAGFELSNVTSGSMAPTLCGDGSPGSDWLLCERVTYWFREPRRWEVVRFTTPEYMDVAKRVVGLPNEQVAIHDEQVMVNGATQSAPAPLAFLRYFPLGGAYGGRYTACGTGYYLLGDDSADSYDSRYEGPVSRDAIRGRAWLIVWPPSRIGWVNNG